METVDKNLQRAKAKAFKTMMKNDSLSSVIFDSWDAPVGSTKTKKASSVIKTMRMAQSRMDGQGGGLTGNTLYNPQLPRVGPTVANAAAINKPKPTAPVAPATPAATADPALAPPQVQTKFLKTLDNKIGVNPLTPGMPTDITGALKAFSQAPIRGTGTPFYIDKMTQGLQASAGLSSKIMQGAKDYGKSITDYLGGSSVDLLKSMGRTVQAGYGLAMEGKIPEQPKWMQPTAKYQSPVSKYSGVVDKVKDTGKAAVVKEQSAAAPTNQSAGSVPIITVNPETGGPAVEKAFESGAPRTVEEVAEISGKNYSAFQNMSEDEVKNLYNSLDPESQADLSFVKEAYDLGIGETAFRMKVLSNEKMMQSLGLPQNVIDTFSKSVLLSDQLVDLRKAKNVEFNLDQQSQRVMDLQARGANITDDLKSYVRGKDEYLGEIDRLIDEGEKTSAYMDKSNPHVAKRMGNYMSYLGMLKGRQTGRYIDMVNSSINYHNKEMDTANKMYEKSYNNAKEAYDSQALITTESYQNITKMIEDMYTNVGKKAEEARTIEKYNVDLLKAYADYEKTVVDTKAAIDKTSGLKVDYDAFDNAAMMYVAGIEKDKFDNYIFQTYDPYEIEARALREGNSPQTAVETFRNALSKSIMTGASSNGKFLDKLDSVRNIYKERIDGAYAQDPDAASEYLQDWINMSSGVGQGVSDGVSAYLNSTDDNKMSTVRASLKHLQDKGHKISKDKFINQYGEDLGDVAAAIYDTYKAITEDGKTSAKEAFAPLLAKEDRLLAQAIGKTAKDYYTNIFN